MFPAGGGGGGYPPGRHRLQKMERWVGNSVHRYGCVRRCGPRAKVAVPTRNLVRGMIGSRGKLKYGNMIGQTTTQRRNRALRERTQKKQEKTLPRLQRHRD